MDRVRLAWIVPTIGRQSLVSALASLHADAFVSDQIIVVADGPRPHARERAIGTTYIETPSKEKRWGATPRTLGFWAAAAMRCTHIAMLDDDDLWLVGSRVKIEQDVSAQPDALHLYKMRIRGGQIIWDTPDVAKHNVSTQMAIFPAIPTFPPWPPVYTGDHAFISALAKAYPVVWHEKIIAMQPDTEATDV